MARKIGCSVLLMFAALQTSGCPFCNPQVEQAIYNSQFYPNLLTMLSAFMVLGIIVGLLSVLSAKWHRANVVAYPTQQISTPVPLLTTAIILGIGIGGFIDGIVLHQILQWHEMLSAKLPPTNYVNKSVNMFWDGVFHAFTLLVTVAGIILFWRLLSRKDINRSGYLFSGGLLLGWGIFNIVEGIIDHHLLKLHNVREIASNPEAWNYYFLSFSFLIMLGGYLLAKKHHAAEEKDG